MTIVSWWYTSRNSSLAISFCSLITKPIAILAPICLHFTKYMSEETSLPLQADLITTRVSIPNTLCPLCCYTLCYLWRKILRKHQYCDKNTHQMYMTNAGKQTMPNHITVTCNSKEYILRWHWCGEAACRLHDTSSRRLDWCSHLGWIGWPVWSFHTLFHHSPPRHGSSWSALPAPEDVEMEAGERSGIMRWEGW